jgi:hypothetical protein
MTFKISSIKAKMDQTLILEAKVGTFTDNTLTIATPKWGTKRDDIIDNQIYRQIPVKVDGVALSAAGRPLVTPGPAFPRMMKLNKRVNNGIELIDK